MSAANKQFCDSYSKLAVDQNQTSIKSNCGFSGLYWSGNRQSYKQWCLSTTEGQARKKALARAETLIKCRLSEGNRESVIPNPTSNTGLHPLTDLLQNNRVDYGSLSYLLSNGTKPDGTGEVVTDSEIPLHVAVKKNDIQAVRILLNYGADVNFFIDSPVLISSVKNNNINLTRLLLEFGASPNINSFGLTSKDVSTSRGFDTFPLGLAKNNQQMRQLLFHFGAQDLNSCIALSK